MNLDFNNQREGKDTDDLLLQLKNISNLKNNNPNLLIKMQQNNQIYLLDNNYNNNLKDSSLHYTKNNNYNNCTCYNYSNISLTNINNYKNIINNKNSTSFPLSQNPTNGNINLIQIQNYNLNNINIIQQLIRNYNENNVNIINILNDINNVYNLNNINGINNKRVLQSNNNNMTNLNQILNYYNSLNNSDVNNTNFINFIRNNNIENSLNNNFRINNSLQNNNQNFNNNFGSLFVNENNYLNKNNPNKYLEDFIKYLRNLSVPLVNFLCTPKGTLEIQKRIGKSNECKIFLINLLNKEGLSTIMKDTYGNYFFQQLIKGTENIIISLIISYISDNFVEISKDSNGTFSVQALLSEISSIRDEQEILNCIKGFEMLMAYDKNAIYVLQKIVLLFPDIHRIYLNEIILNNFIDLCLDSNGICLIKNFIKTNTLQNNKQRIIEEIVQNFNVLAESPFGNYGIQYLMENWNKNDLNDIKNKIMENIYKLSMQQYSSNVVEKAIEIFEEDVKERMIKKICFESNFVVILKNKFGRFVIHKAIEYMRDDLKKKFELFLINNINNNIFSNKDKSKVKKFLMKIKNTILQNDCKFALDNEFVRNNKGNICNFNKKNNIINNNCQNNNYFL